MEFRNTSKCTKNKIFNERNSNLFNLNKTSNTFLTFIPIYSKKINNNAHLFSFKFCLTVLLLFNGENNFISTKIYIMLYTSTKNIHKTFLLSELIVFLLNVCKRDLNFKSLNNSKIIIVLYSKVLSKTPLC